MQNIHFSFCFGTEGELLVFKFEAFQLFVFNFEAFLFCSQKLYPKEREESIFSSTQVFSFCNRDSFCISKEGKIRA